MFCHLDILVGLKSLSETSNGFISWSLNVIAASILALIGTSYLKPASKKIRLIYLLFIPGWCLLYVSMYYGNVVARRFGACAFTTDNEKLLDFGSKLNSDLLQQMYFFKVGISVFAIWLFLYLVWWVFGEWEIKK